MSWGLALLLAVAFQRLFELRLAARNTQRLLSRGGVEHGRAHYPVVVVLHATWLAALFVWVAWENPVLAPGWVAAFFVLQVFRIWTIVSLGPYWTTRVIVVPGATPVSHGPYRFLRHPNYLIVLAEIVILPLALEAREIALGFGIVNGFVLLHRIRVEDEARRAARISEPVTGNRD